MLERPQLPFWWDLSSSDAQLSCRGIGYGSEPAPILSEEPLRADGLREAIINALRDAAASWEDVDYRISDANGEQYWFKEASLALMRTMRIRKDAHGSVASGRLHGRDRRGDRPLCSRPRSPCRQKAIAPGPGVLCHFSGDGPERGVLVLHGTVPRVLFTELLEFGLFLMRSYRWLTRSMLTDGDLLQVRTREIGLAPSPMSASLRRRLLPPRRACLSLIQTQE